MYDILLLLLRFHTYFMRLLLKNCFMSRHSRTQHSNVSGYETKHFKWWKLWENIAYFNFTHSLIIYSKAILKQYLARKKCVWLFVYNQYNSKVIHSCCLLGVKEPEYNIHKICGENGIGIKTNSKFWQPINFRHCLFPHLAEAKKKSIKHPPQYSFARGCIT